jgi:dimethylargininase
MELHKAIVRLPCRNMVNGIKSRDLGIPDYRKALSQHRQYIEVLEKCGLKVMIMEADEAFPDSVFIEDTALLTPKFALITRPGAPSRQGETPAVERKVREFYSTIYHIQPPGTLDGGDVLAMGPRYFIGLSGRTSDDGLDQLTDLLRQYGLQGFEIRLKNLLHLKSGVSYLGDDTLLVAKPLTGFSMFEEYRRIPVPPEETDAANALRINDYVLLPSGFPQTLERVRKGGFTVITLDISEFHKLDGGLSCMSLRF